MPVLKGFNTGWATFDVQVNGEWTVNKAWYDFYGTWSPAMSAWYLKEGHLEDGINTWHTDERVNPYLANPYAWITSQVGIGPADVKVGRTGEAPNPSGPSSRIAAGAAFALRSGPVRFDAAGRTIAQWASQQVAR